VNYILIPSYEPTDKLIKLIEDLLALEPEINILIVNDGSGHEFARFFIQAENLGATVLHHEVNKGKGAALKTGKVYLMKQKNVGSIVCADSDGQHKPKDIFACLHASIANPDSYVLGVRKFKGNVPLRSRFGNRVTKLVYLAASGTSLQDTQTGLRAFGKNLMPWLLEIKGNRFEYEMNALLEAPRAGIPFHQLEIETVYDQVKHTSHFRTFRDSFRVYLPIVKFSSASLISGIVDYFTLLILVTQGVQLLRAVITSRILSGTINFTINRKFVFKDQSDLKGALLRYISVALTVVTLDYFLLNFFNKTLKIHISIAKLIAESILALFSFWLQRLFVFSVKKN
jgi:putative flippase GtrA